MADEIAETKQMYGIQMLRALAALSVIIHHILELAKGAVETASPDWVTRSGASGVDIFFVISGFIMLKVSFSAGRDTPLPGNFLIRRAIRIYPFYWLCSAAIFGLWLVGFLASHHYGGEVLIASLFLLPGPKLLDVAWTLVYEVYFYLLFACTLRFRSAAISLWATTGAIVGICGIAMAMPPGIRSPFLASPLPIEFCLGLGLAYLHERAVRAGRPWRVAPVVTVVGLAAITVGAMFVDRTQTAGMLPLPRLLVWGIPAVLVLAGVLNVGAPRSRLSRFAVLLGDASYALYLTHAFVMIGYGGLLKIDAVRRLPQLPLVVAVMLVAVSVGLAAHLFVEKPMLAAIRRTTRRRRARAAPSLV